MPTRHLILIHGRSTKPQRSEKERLTRLALLGGLDRVSPAAARAVRDGQVKLTFVYYGDITNELMIRADPKHRKGMVKIGDGWFEKDGSYDDDLAMLLARATEHHTLRHYKAMLKEERDLAAVDDVFRILSPVVSTFGLSGHVIRKLLPDLAAYLTSRVWGSKVRQRLQAPLRQAMLAGDEIALVSHSMGCIVSYDVLWKFSRMSEYEDIHDRRISLWMTIGSPLGDPFTKSHLYDSNEPDDGRYPANIESWLNIAARDDFVAYDGDVADDFRDMKRRRLVRSIEDMDRICTFWVGRDGSNPHKLYGYLNHPTVARRLAQWIER